jgi:hypothetical protein
MTEFWSYFENGIWHILNPFVCKHILFLIVMVAPFAFKDWIKLLVLISIFTLGNVLALTLSVFGIVIIKGHLISLLVPIIIFLVALFNLFSGKLLKPLNVNVVGFVSLTFGILHGLDISSFFNLLTKSAHQIKFLTIVEFSLGIEAAQILVVFLVLLFTYFCQTLVRFSKRDCTLVLSSFVIGVVLPIIMKNEIWKVLN